MAQQYTTLASLGQQYQDYPGAPFGERFGSPLTPEQERALAQELFRQEHQKYLQEQMQRQRTPEYTWPAGLIRI